MVAKKSAAAMGVALILVLVGLFAVSVLFDLGLEGTDDQASEVIGTLRPDYEPWMQNLFEPGEQAEKALFALQILLGVGIGWYCIVRLRKNRHAR